jgi:hypothetical protein
MIKQVTGCRTARVATRCRAFLMLVVVVTGCAGEDELDDVYGLRRGTHASSVNGTVVLSSMFEEADFRVYSWRRLAPRLEAYQTIVWFPNDFGPPSDEQRVFLEDWLAEEANRTLVYVGRDYDASVDYWRMILPQTPVAEREEVMRRAAESLAEQMTRRLAMPKDDCFEWFVVQRGAARRQITELSGDWAENLNGEEAAIRVTGQLTIPDAEQLESYRDQLEENVPTEVPRFRQLLVGDGTTLVYQLTKPSWVNSKIIVVANGSFLLNLPLVNHQHRRLAGRLIRACGEPAKVAFLESGPGGPPISRRDMAQDPRNDARRRERVLLATHWLILGLVYCLCVLPIFGRPKRGQQPMVADFGKHVQALGAMLQQGGDREYAREKIEQYHRLVKRETVPQPIPEQERRHEPEMRKS